MNCLILGGGPSLLDSLKGRICKKDDWFTIGVNLAFMFGDWENVCYFLDALLWWNHEEGLKRFGGRKISLDKTKEGVKSIVGIAPDVEVWRRKGGHGICTIPKTAYASRTSGGSAINIAYHLGAKRIFLLGYDMHGDVNGWMQNWYPEKYQRQPSKKGYAASMAPFVRIAEDAKRLGLEIFNATPGSALPNFPFVDIEDYNCLSGGGQ